VTTNRDGARNLRERLANAGQELYLVGFYGVASRREHSIPLNRYHGAVSEITDIKLASLNIW
jgi:hypothetical protein